jgi:hypothetical protein
MLALFHALLAAVIIGQCGASLALVVRADWHEAAHRHHAEDDHDHAHEGHDHGDEPAHPAEDESHDCPVVQLAHGLWAAPALPVFVVPRPPAPAGALTFPDTSRAVPALFLTTSVLEHAPPARA